MSNAEKLQSIVGETIAEVKDHGKYSGSIVIKLKDGREVYLYAECRGSQGFLFTDFMSEQVLNNE